MKIIMTTIIAMLGTVSTFAQSLTAESKPGGLELEPGSMTDVLLPILLISFLVFMLITLIKYFLEFRLKNKLIDKGMGEQLSTYLSEKNPKERQNEAMKLAILFCGIGSGLLLTYVTAPINIHSLAIMAFSLGASYFAYFFYLKKQNA